MVSYSYNNLIQILLTMNESLKADIKGQKSKLTKSYLETSFNVPLTGQQISELYFYMCYWQVQNEHCFDSKNKDYIQEHVDDFENLELTLKKPIKTYESNFI